MIVVCDIDHTISDAAWRDGLIGNWDEYFPAGDRDAPVTEMIALLKALDQSGHTIIGLTGRNERWRSLTNQWLMRYDVPMDEVLMRPDDNFERSPVVKMMLLRQRFEDLSVIGLVIDDRDDVIAMMAEANITSLRCLARRAV